MVVAISLLSSCGDDGAVSACADGCTDAAWQDAARLDAGSDVSDAGGSDAEVTDAGVACPADYSCAAQSSIPASECEILMDLYCGSDGPTWTRNSGWLVAGNPCDWQGVVCLEGRVDRISLPNNGLTGTIPAELGNLTNLTSLSLDGNQLVGSIPAALGSLQSLERLVLFFNQLSGSIPPELGNLTSIDSLQLQRNLLTGGIPTELGTLTNLRGLDLKDNQLTGSIPPELGSLVNLQVLSLDNNQLSGIIPATLGGLSQMINVFLQGNQLSALAPDVLDDMPLLQRVFLEDNLLDQAAVDAVFIQLHAGRDGYITSTPEVNVSGTNASPSGLSTDPSVTPGAGNSDANWSWNGAGHDPLSGKAMSYDLANDVRAEGFNT